MKFENKKWVLRVALAGALSLGVATVAKADDSAAVAAPTFSLVAQELGAQTFGTWDGKTGDHTTTNSTNGDKLNFGLEHVQVGAAFGIDSLDTVTVKSDLATGTLTLLDAYDVHSLSDLNAGLAVKVGQIKLPFGANAYADPDQLIRTGYSSIDSLVPAGNLTNGNITPSGITTGSTYDYGAEIDQTFNDLTIQVAVVQNGSLASSLQTGDKDYVGRIQWKGSNLTLGLSDYYSATATAVGMGSPNNLNTLGANASVNVDIFQLDLEAIFGDKGTNGYTGTLSAKTNGFQPAVWYEFIASNSTPAAGVNGVANNDLGAGVNFWLASKTRLALDLDFTGYNAGPVPAASAGDLLAANVESVQLTESF